MKTPILPHLIFFGVLAASAVQADTVDDLLAAYKAQDAGPFNATAGAALWQRMVKGNPDVGSFSRCETYHRGADRGNFDEHGVRIPGDGRWDD
jgi:hypothetical protein